MFSRTRASLLALGLAAAGGGAATAAAVPARSDGERPGGASRLAAEGLHLLKRALRLEQRADRVVSYTVSIGSREAILELDLAGGATRIVTLKAGGLYVDGNAVGQYTAGGPLERSWRRLLADAGAQETRQFLASLQAWQVDGLSGADLAAKQRMDAALTGLEPAAPAAAGGVPAPGAARAATAVAPALPALPPADIAEPAAPEAEAAAAPSAIQILFRDVRNIVAIFIALAMIGFGTVFFARRHVEVVADTASNAFARSLVVGLLGQLLLLPTLAMLIVGLIFTIVGILLLPFAVVAYVIAACIAMLGGYLAVAHAIGETFTRRRLATGAFVRSPNAYGYLFTGLVGLLGLWAAAALFGWAGPVVFVFRAAAVIATWLAATVGFGAVLLSRAGLRETFAGRYAGDQSDEYLWATPPATPAAPRPEGGRRA